MNPLFSNFLEDILDFSKLFTTSFFTAVHQTDNYMQRKYINLKYLNINFNISKSLLNTTEVIFSSKVYKINSFIW